MLEKLPSVSLVRNQHFEACLVAPAIATKRCPSGLCYYKCMKNIFFVGPASVGKSTVAKHLAKSLGWSFVDIDLYFCDEIAPIPDYINENGYAAYCQKSSELTDDLVERFATRTIFATPSGFLVHEESPDLVEKHVNLIDTNAISVLLLPSENPYDTVDMIINRQLDRWPEVNPAVERKRYISRHEKYKQYGTVKIIGQCKPDEVADLIVKECGLPT